MAVESKKSSNQKTCSLREIICGMDKKSVKNAEGQMPQWGEGAVRTPICPDHGTKLEPWLPINKKFIVETCCETFQKLVSQTISEA